MKKTLQIILVLTVLIACNDTNSTAERTMTLGGSEINSLVAKESRFSAKPDQINQKNEPQNQLQTSRKLIKNGYIIFETADLNQTKTNILSLVEKYQGYLASDTQNEYNNRINYRLNIRIPAQSFDSILSGISKEIINLDSKEISISDVTAEFLDIESRLKNKKELENRYIQILKRANTVKDILDVEREIGKLREDIESTQGRLNYLKNQVSFSTLQVTFYKKTTSETPFFTQIKDAFSNGFDKAKTFFVWFISTWPFLIVFFILIFSYRLYKNRKK